MICGVAELLRRRQSLHAIDRDTLAAVYMAWQRAPRIRREDRTDIGREIEEVLFESDADREDHFRKSLELQLAAGLGRVRELDRLTTDPDLAGLAGRLAVEWLRRYPSLRCSTQEDLLACALDCADEETVRELVVDFRERACPDQETRLLWLSADHVVDLENRRPLLEAAAAEHPAFIWDVRDRIAPRAGERFDRLSLDHLAFIVESFGDCWSNVPRPTSVTRGDCNPWDASAFIRQTIGAIASLRSPDATEALQGLIDRHAASYTPVMKHALALQRRARRDVEYTAPRLDELRAVMANDPPESIDDMRAWFAERLEELQERLRGSATNMWAAYWTEDTRPRGENFCRDRLIEHISVNLPPSIQLGRETSMPLDKRADIALTRNTMKLPVEIKGQWNRDVWNAVNDQLDARYTVDWQAEGRGVYIVLWFGDVPGQNLTKHPDGLEPPESPGELRNMLVDRLTEIQRGRIDVFVIDLSRPAGTV